MCASPSFSFCRIWSTTVSIAGAEWAAGGESSRQRLAERLAERLHVRSRAHLVVEHALLVHLLLNHTLSAINLVLQCPELGFEENIFILHQDQTVTVMGVSSSNLEFQCVHTLQCQFGVVAALQVINLCVCVLLHEFLLVLSATNASRGLPLFLRTLAQCCGFPAPEPPAAAEPALDTVGCDTPFCSGHQQGVTGGRLPAAEARECTAGLGEPPPHP